jgi:1-acyl-sn-glycerol-3-phosphate acyltransferase
MAAVFSAVFWALLILGSAVLFVGAVVLWLVTLPFDPNGRVLHMYSCFWGQLFFRVNPLWHLRVEGRQRLPWRGGAVLVSNHQSLGDILVLFGLWRPFKWVSKESNFRIPFIGWNMTLNRYVRLVRGDKESIAAMMQTCEDWLQRGVAVLLFPEGTRSPDGEVKAFKDGAFRLAIGAKVPVIPIALTGTADVLPKHGWVLRGRADCRLRVLPPVDPKPFQGDVAALREHVRTLIIEEKRKMSAERAHRPHLKRTADHQPPAGGRS